MIVSFLKRCCRKLKVSEIWSQIGNYLEKWALVNYDFGYLMPSLSLALNVEP